MYCPRYVLNLLFDTPAAKFVSRFADLVSVLLAFFLTTAPLIPTLAMADRFQTMHHRCGAKEMAIGTSHVCKIPIALTTTCYTSAIAVIAISMCDARAASIGWGFIFLVICCLRTFTVRYSEIIMKGVQICT